MTTLGDLVALIKDHPWILFFVWLLMNTVIDALDRRRCR